MRKTYLYKAKINKQTEANCNQWIDLCRRLYNQSLEQRIKAYKEEGKFISAYSQMSQRNMSMKMRHFYKTFSVPLHHSSISAY